MKTNLTSYSLYLTNKSKSPNTIKSYSTHIGEYFNNFPQITRHNILAFKKLLQNKSQSSTSINAKLSALKSYNEYLISTSELQSLLIISDDFISIQKQSISPTKHDLKKIEQIFEKVKLIESYRNIAIIYLLLSTGIRREELTNIKLSHIDFKNRSLNIINGKGGKDRKVIINYKVVEVLQFYINSERKNSPYKNSQYLFVTERSDKMHKETVNKIMKPYKINPHALRHFWASEALRRGATLASVASNLGHSSLNTVSKYTHPTEKEMIEQADNMIIGF